MVGSHVTLSFREVARSRAKVNDDYTGARTQHRRWQHDLKRCSIPGWTVVYLVTDWPHTPLLAMQWLVDAPVVSFVCGAVL
jgi:hypothetical protein